MTNELSHYDAIKARIARETERRDSLVMSMFVRKSDLESAKSFRDHQIKMAEKELQAEIEFLKTKGIDLSPVDCDMTDDELLRELLA